MKENCSYFQQNIEQQDQEWQDYQEYLSGFGIKMQEPDFAFSKKVRREMIERDGGCQWFTDDHEGGLEAAHTDHSRSNPNYNSLDNGQMLCTKHHRADHVERAGSNGLSFEHNNFAIKSLDKKLKK
jgi:hypothetical protein